jgi:signal transduction histidine kinase/putative methionine-R-sulfoxide reductase with GAF domain
VNVVPNQRLAKVEGRVADLEAALARARVVGEALRRVGQAVGESADIEDLLVLIVETSAEVVEADRATLYLLENDKLVARVKQGAELASIVVDVGKGIAGHVAESGEPIRVRDAYKDRRFDPAWDKKSGYRTRSALAVPLRSHHGQILGVLQALNKKAAPGRAAVFTPYDVELLETLATQAAVSLDKHRMIHRLRKQYAELSNTKERLERSLGDLGLLYELEVAMSRAESIAQLVRSVITLTGRACDAEAGAILHQQDNGELLLYVVNLAAPDEVRQVQVQPGEGVAARAMVEQASLCIDDPRRVGDPERVRELLGIDVRTAIAAPLGSGDEKVAGAIALYNHRPPDRFQEEDVALLKLVSANVTTELRLFDWREQRERAERLGSIGRLLSGVMHDLRTPLTVVSGYVQLMQASDDPAVRAEYGQTIREQFDIITAMQRDLLAYARGETTLLVRKVYVGRFCESLVKQLQPELERAGIAVELRLTGEGTAYVDEAKLARAVGNLLRNAVEAMEPAGRGTLLLRCDSDGDDLVIEVADSGPGIPKSIRKTLFDPFVTHGKKTGTGLGLANVKKIVEEHGGTITVDTSKNGTSFTIRIPSATMPHSLRPASARQSTRRPEGGDVPQSMRSRQT